MSSSVERASKWFYRGLWGFLTKWFCIPDQALTLPTPDGALVHSFRPSDRFLPYLKIQFWLAMLLIHLLPTALWIVALVGAPWVALALTPLLLLWYAVPGMLAYLGIHLRFDTTWYALSDRSMRIRRGIWIIHDTTITFENIQNVTVNQGPLQRYFQIADVIVQTAGGGGATHGKGGPPMAGSHQGLLEGISNAPEIRDLILSRLKKSRTAGLGDEDDESPRTPAATWTPTHLQYLREIRDAANQLVG